ncbi:MAG TPA: hypothetical protein VJ732_18580 [Bryobacteraceae bacterium]|nr:hypothetical protein [Bryobacteraceae bacterium]
MRLWAFLLVFPVVGAGIFLARSGGDDPATRAKAQLESLRRVRDTAAAPGDVADAEDTAYVRRQLAVQDLTESQAEDLIEAAGRRYERRKQAFERLQGQTAAGAQAALAKARQEMDLARQECDLAFVRARMVRDVAAMAQEEQLLQQRMDRAQVSPTLGEHSDGNGIFTAKTFTEVESAFEKRYGHPLPVSAMGETAVHRAMGFDHRGRVDVALDPDQPEGVWLRAYLAGNHIPYFAFRHAVPGKATGAHIHLGPQSGRLPHGG